MVHSVNGALHSIIIIIIKRMPRAGA